MTLLSAETPAIADLCIAGAQAKVEQFEINCYRALVKAAEQISAPDLSSSRYGKPTILNNDAQIMTRNILARMIGKKLEG